MASRLTVIISQSAVRQSQFADVEEALLTELMLAAGMDATLIGPLGNVESNSTDYLCLSGFTHSLALVSGLATADVAQQWQRLQLAGQVVPLVPAAQAGPGTPPPGGQRIYHLPVQLGTQTILAQLRGLLADKAVQTVNVLLPQAAKLPTIAPAPQRPGRGPAQVANSQGANSQGAKPQGAKPSAGTVAAGAASQVDAEWPDLDRLVDDFDSLDI